MKYRNILGFSNAKTSKGEKKGYLTGILYLAPSTMVDGLNLCPFASKGCKQACLFTAGRGKFSNVKDARINKTVLFRDKQEFFMLSLINDIKKLIRKAKRENVIPVVRLNGTSDIRWENIEHKGQNIFDMFPETQFYDYTKDFKRYEKELPSNYHLTFSLSESNKLQAKNLLNNGHNVAIVFRKDLPENWNGFKVINGDDTDLRFLDAKNVVVGLKAKGDAKKDQSGFVQA